MILYKYVAGRKDILENQKIRFSQVQALNDPFELNPCLDLYRKDCDEVIREIFQINEEFRKLNRLYQEFEIQKLVNNQCKNIIEVIHQSFLVLSLTKERNNLLMWSHYCNSHQGFVLGFNSENSFFKRKNQRMTEIYEVAYSNNRPDLSACTKIFSQNINIDGIIKILTTKSKHWEYEKEVRMFAQFDQTKIVGVDNAGFDIYLFDFPSECLKEVIFGFQMSAESKKEIAQIVKSKYAHAELFEAKLRADIFDLQIQYYQSN